MAFGDSLKAQSLDQPIKQGRRIVLLDGTKNASFTQLGTQIIDVGRRARQAACGVNQFDRIGKIRIERRHLGANSDHRNELALRITIAVDVSLRRLNRSIASQQLDVAQRSAGMMNQPRGAGNESPSTRMRRTPVKPT